MCPFFGEGGGGLCRPGWDKIPSISKTLFWGLPLGQGPKKRFFLARFPKEARLLHILGSREVWWLLTTFYLPHHKHRSARNPLHTTLLSKLPRQLLRIFANSLPKPLSAFAYTGLQSAPPLANNQLFKNLDSKWQLLGFFIMCEKLCAVQIARQSENHCPFLKYSQRTGGTVTAAEEVKCQVCQLKKPRTSSEWNSAVCNQGTSCPLEQIRSHNCGVKSGNALWIS